MGPVDVDVDVGELVGLDELLADADGLALGDVVRDGVGLTDFDGCGLPTGSGELDGGIGTRLGLGVGVGLELVCV